MAELRLVRTAYAAAPPPHSYDDHTIFQTKPWLDFVAEAQGAEPVVATVHAEDDRVVGRYTGLLVRRFGVPILGSPFPGWTTQYMGFNLEPGVGRADALAALERFAFRDLGCAHLEVMDRRATLDDHEAAGFRHRFLEGYEIDLTRDEDEIFGGMSSACRRCVRKAEKEGVRIEIAEREGFADDYYAQLRDVFAKQRLAPTYSRERVEALLRHVHPTGNLLLLRARDPEGTSIATALFPALNDTVYFWGGASWRSHQKFRPNEAIMWFAMRYWKERGIERYDMGGSGSYKRKYGGRDIRIPWGRASRIPALELMRTAARRAVGARQRLAGARLS